MPVTLRAAERGSVGVGRNAHYPFELTPERCGGAQAGGCGDCFDAVVGGLQQLLGATDALGQEPLEWRLAGRRAELAAEVARAGIRTPGEVGDGQRLVQPLLRPREQLREGVIAAHRDRRRDELRLAAGAMRRYDETPGDRVRDRRAVVEVDEVET